MKKLITNFIEFKRVIIRTQKKYGVCFTRYGFYYRTKKCNFFFSCRSMIDRIDVFKFLRENQIQHYKLEELL